MGWFKTGVAAAVLAGLVLAWVAWNSERRLNVILICLDTVRYDAFWLVESAGLDDPLAGNLPQALRFRRAQAVSPWTIPSVASVMTGLLPPRHAAGRLEGPVSNLDEQIPTALPDQLPTIAQILSDRGYETVNFNSHPWLILEEFGLSRGFEDQRWAADEEVLEEVFRWLIGHGRKLQPFFLNLHFMAAHEKYKAPESVVGRNLRDMDSGLRDAAQGLLGENGVSPSEEMKQRFSEYCRSVGILRTRLAKLIWVLNQMELLGNTILVAYSDHGEEFGDHLEEALQRTSDPRGHSQGWGHGQSLYQELLHVPVVAWVPGVDGADVDTPVSLVDIAPTLLGWLRLEHLAPAWDGRDLTTLIGAPYPEDPRPLYSTAVAYGPPRSALLLGNWKLLHGPGKLQLFDLARDPRERRPLEFPDPQLVEELRALLEEFESAELAAPSSVPTLSPQQLERLRSLGYLGSADQ